MPVYDVYALGASNISISGGQSLSGISQGDGSHLLGETISLDSNAWELVGVSDTEAQFDDSDNSQSLAAAQSFDGSPYSGGERVEAEYQLTLQDPDGNTYTVLGFNINTSDGLPSYGSVEGLAFVGGVGGFPPIGVPLTVISTSEGPSQPYAALASPPCFTAGTLVPTEDGLTPVESLQAGQRIQTLDSGIKPVLWVGKARLPKAVLQNDARFRPVRVCKDAFGPGCPNRDMHLSQQHRVLVQGWRAELFFGDEEVLVPIGKLVNDSTVRIEPNPEDVTYVHILFDQHEVIWADGMLSESYLPSASQDDPTAREVMQIFPQLSCRCGDVHAARTCIPGGRAHLLA